MAFNVNRAILNDLFETKKQIDAIDWSLSTKKVRVNGKVYTYYYKQRTDPVTHVRSQEIVKKKDVKATLAEAEKKRQLKQHYHWMQEQIDKEKCKQKKALVQMYKVLELENLHKQNVEIPEKRREINPETEKLHICQVSGDGTRYDSRAELAIEGNLRYLGIKAVHNEPLEPGNPESYTFDFTFKHKGKKYYLEHMGMMQNGEYSNHQREKLNKYAWRDITQNKNLLIVTSLNDQLLIPDLLWELLRFGIITPQLVRSRYLVSEKKIHKNKTFEVWKKPSQRMVNLKMKNKDNMSY